jgi:hypothetical protein
MEQNDIAALIQSALGEFQKNVLPGVLTAAFNPIQQQMTGIGEALKGLKPAEPAQPQQQPQTPQQPQTQQTQQPQAQVSPEVNAMMLEMKRTIENQAAQVKALNDKNAESERKADIAERQSIIDRALGDFSFARPEARQTALRLIESEIKRMDDGTLVAGENLTPDAFIKDFIPNQHAYLLAPVNAGGSGASVGVSMQGARAATTEMIGPNMKAEDRAAIVAAIQNASASLGR